MGQNLSLKIFQTLNDIHITLGSGVLGILILLRNGMHTYVGKTLFLAGLFFASIQYALLSKEMNRVSKNKVVFISGCDSGLGFSLAQHTYEMGFTVFAGCLNSKSDGAKALLNVCKKINIIELDITKKESVQNVVVKIEEYIRKNTENVFWALINNAGVMVFGEFEWQTDNLIQNQLDINLFGTMLLTKAFMPLSRKYSSRIITISSHCASETLPGLSVYGATKAGLAAWHEGLRVELNKYGIDVISLIPGSFIQQSNIMSRLNENVFEMQEAMTQEQKDFYGDYFRQYNSYLNALSGTREPKKIADYKLYQVFEKSLLEKSPQKCYKNEPWRYTFYHTLFKISPTRLRDYLVVKFIQMPEWDRGRKLNHIAQIIA